MPKEIFTPTTAKATGGAFLATFIGPHLRKAVRGAVDPDRNNDWVPVATNVVAGAIILIPRAPGTWQAFQLTMSAVFFGGALYGVLRNINILG